MAEMTTREIEWALDKILSKPLTLGSERRALTLLGLLGVKPLRAAGKLTLKRVRQHALKVGRDAEAGLRRDRAEESRRAAGKGRGK